VFRQTSIAFDAAVRDGLFALGSPALTTFFRGVTLFGSERILIPFGVVVVWRLAAAGRRHAAVLFLIAALGGEALEQILKLFFRRARPDALFGDALPSTYSFPSGHAMISVCFYGVLAALLAPKLATVGARAAVWAGAVGAVLLIGTSRIYLGVHYPSDVVGGYAAALVWVLAIRAAYRVWRDRSSGGVQTR
jgi:undecaprenyl-diphosphatase